MRTFFLWMNEFEWMIIKLIISSHHYIILNSIGNIKISPLHSYYLSNFIIIIIIIFQLYHHHHSLSLSYKKNDRKRWFICIIKKKEEKEIPHIPTTQKEVKVVTPSSDGAPLCIRYSSQPTNEAKRSTKPIPNPISRVTRSNLSSNPDPSLRSLGLTAPLRERSTSFRSSSAKRKWKSHLSSSLREK